MADYLKTNALNMLSRYIDEATQLGNSKADCCFFATAADNQQPSVRMITIQKIDEQGLLFLVNKHSGKAKQFQTNPRVGLCFYWPETEMQATIEGNVTELERSTAEILWKKRDYHAQLTAWALETSKDESCDSLSDHKSEIREHFSGNKPTLAASWAGYIIEPTRIEFWKNHWRKNKKRECFSNASGQWEKDESY